MNNTIVSIVFDFANSIDPEDAGNMYSWFTQMGGYTLYQKENKKSQES